MTCRCRRFLSSCFFFFFQAEDGIRDLTVTGVQTCALPISQTSIPFNCARTPVPPSLTTPYIPSTTFCTLAGSSFHSLGGACCPFTRCGLCQDRKSTRLNSSHSQISYAVFCLKKKNHHRSTSWKIRFPSSLKSGELLRNNILQRDSQSPMRCTRSRSSKRTLRYRT